MIVPATSVSSESSGHDSAPDTPGGGWRNYLLSQPWALQVADLRRNRLAVTCSVPRGEGPASPVTLVYQREPEGRWTVRSEILDLTLPTLLPMGGLVGLHGHGPAGAGLCRLNDDGGGHHLIAVLDGPRGLARNHTDERVAVLHRIAGASDPLTISRRNPIGYAGPARSRSGGWAVSVADTAVPGARTVTHDLGPLLDDGAQPTGEIVWLGPDVVLVGVSQDDPDGRRRLGLALLTPGGRRIGSIWHPDRDLHGVLPGPTGRGCAVRASTRDHDADDPLRHEVWWCPSVGGADPAAPPSPDWTVLDDGREIWRTPAAWSGSDLITLAVERGRRRAARATPGNGTGWSAVDGAGSTGSVSSMVVEAGRAVWVTSSPAGPPQLVTGELTGGPSLVIDEGARPPWVLGDVRHRDHLITAAGRRHATGSRIIRPAGRPRGVVAIFHGGPTMAWADWSWRWNPGPYVEQGWAVVLVDPAGSDGLGRASWQVAWRNWRHGIVPSALATLRRALDEPDLAGLPVATLGGSFGGYLALAAACELPVALVAAHATPVRPREVALASDAYWSWLREWGTLPGRAQALEAESLDLDLVPVGTRVLLSHGMLDEQVPFDQSVTAARWLRSRQVHCELALFPTAGHALGRPDWITSWYAWTIDALETMGNEQLC